METKEDAEKKGNETKKEKTNALKKALSPRPKKEKPPKPRKYIFRKFGAVTFWILFSFMFLVVLVSMSSSSSANDRKVEETKAAVNPATKPEAIQFARSFVADYFSWQADSAGFDDRKARLHKYLAKGIDSQAGLSTNNLDWDTSFENATIKKIDETGKNKAHIVFEVTSKWTREKEVEVGKGKKKEKKMQTDSKDVKKQFAVPILYNGETYGVYELPYFTSIADQTNVKMNERKSPKLKRMKESDERKNIESFLRTFFASFAADSKDKLSYILSDKQHPTGLNGAMEFRDVKNTEVYEGDDNHHFLVSTEAEFEDPDLKTIFDTSYEMEISKVNNHYVVSQLNAESVFDALTDFTHTDQIGDTSSGGNDNDEEGNDEATE